MTDRYCVTCKKPIRGHAIGAHIQHKHTVRNHAPVVAAKPKPLVGMSGMPGSQKGEDAWQVSKATDALDKARSADAIHSERLLVLHEKMLDVILLLGKMPALVPVAEKLLSAVADETKRIPFWLLSGIGGIAPALLASTYSKEKA